MTCPYIINLSGVYEYSDIVHSVIEESFWNEEHQLTMTSKSILKESDNGNRLRFQCADSKKELGRLTIPSELYNMKTVTLGKGSKSIHNITDKDLTIVIGNVIIRVLLKYLALLSKISRAH